MNSFADEGGQADDLTMRSGKSPKPTLRMENRERAYTAASRRVDRSLEARYQSALMASRVHKRRTGKALRITHEIVAKEEIYEEEDNVLPQSWCSPSERKERTTFSQTDTFIAALIARTFGLPNSIQQNRALLASQFTNSMPWGHSVEYNPANNGDTTHILQQEPKLDLLEDISNCPEELNAIDTVQALGERSTNTESYFLDAPLFHDATPLGHKSTITSSISDTSNRDSNCSFGMNSEEGDSNTAAYSPKLESSVVDFDCESFL